MTARPMKRTTCEITVDGDIARVTLTRGFMAVIDAADVPNVSAFRWSTLINNQTGHAYAVRYKSGGGSVLMHRQLLCSLPGEQVDHVDGDGLNNRRANIRHCTHSQNQANQVHQRRNRLGVKGVKPASKNTFSARVEVNGRRVYLGCFPGDYGFYEPRGIG